MNEAGLPLPTEQTRKWVKEDFSPRRLRRANPCSILVTCVLLSHFMSLMNTLKQDSVS